MFSVMKLVLVIVFATTLAHAADAPITQDELVRRTQELYDAVVPGNQAPWKKYFADDCIFSDEKGRILDKAKLIADITPLPAGYSGTIKIENVQSRILGETAILSYDSNETETIFGQNLTARYHVTDTWLRRSGEWKIIASQAHRYYEDPAIGKIDPKKFADFIGTYELAPGQTRLVTAEGENLFVERKGKKEQLFPETSELFFRKGVEGRILFRYDANGKVDALIDRRNNEDVIWRKTK
jgi:hypothetical protein